MAGTAQEMEEVKAVEMDLAIEEGLEAVLDAAAMVVEKVAG